MTEKTTESDVMVMDFTSDIKDHMNDGNGDVFRRNMPSNFLNDTSELDQISAHLEQQIQSKAGKRKKKGGDEKLNLSRKEKKQVLAGDDLKKHQNLVMHLSRYGQSERFKEYLKLLDFDLKPNKLKELCVEELQELLNRVSIAIQSKQQSSFIKDGFFGAVNFGESILQTIPSEKRRIDFAGLAQNLEGNEQMLDILEEIQLSYHDYTSMRAELRLLLLVCQSAMAVHAHNKMANSAKAKQLSRLEALKQIQAHKEKPENTEEEKRGLEMMEKKIQEDLQENCQKQFVEEEEEEEEKEEKETKEKKKPNSAPIRTGNNVFINY